MQLQLQSMLAGLAVLIYVFVYWLNACPNDPAAHL